MNALRSKQYLAKSKEALAYVALLLGPPLSKMESRIKTFRQEQRPFTILA